MITAEELRDTLDYDPTTGIFTWRISHSNRAKIGAVAGSASVPYRYIRINKQSFLAHRLAWLHVYGQWPDEQIDHINGDKLDNRIVNLRKASPSQNGMNRGKQADNKSGFKGVSWNKRDRRWCAFIKKNRKTHFLGGFNSVDEAHRAYQQAASNLHGEYART